MMTAQEHAKIALEVESLRELTVSQLQHKWVEVWGEACRSRNKDFLRKRIAWKIQANAYGGLSERALARARELADESLLKVRAPAPPGPPLLQGKTVHHRIHAAGDPRIPSPGTVIVRDYKGRKLLVAVLEKGFEFEGRTYRSLSAIAKEVTGTHWNGVRFFGLDEGRAA
jgi:Protein of unknown function (DUF2924)